MASVINANRGSDLATIHVMSLPIQVTAYSGHEANERPCSFIVDEDVYDIQVLGRRWHEPSFTFFKVLTTHGKTFVLRYNDRADE